MDRRPDRGYGPERSCLFAVLTGPSPVWFRSFSGYETGLTNTTNTCNRNQSFQSINATSKRSWLLLKQNGWLRCILGLRSTFILSFIFVLTIHSNEWKATSMNGRLSHFWISLSAVSKSFDLDSNLQLWSNPGVTLARFYCDRNTRNAFSRLFSELFRIIPELTGIWIDIKVLRILSRWSSGTPPSNHFRRRGSSSTGIRWRTAGICR